MGRNAERELERIVDKIGEYLDRAAKDSSLPLTYEGIEEQTGVSRGHLSRRKEPQILDLVTRIASLKGGRRDGPTGPSQGAPLAASSLENSSYAAMTNDALAVIVRREMREVARLQEQWVSRHARSDVHDAPLALYDADELLPRLRAAIERLRPAVAEWNRRHGIVTSLASAASDTQIAMLGI